MYEQTSDRLASKQQYLSVAAITPYCPDREALGLACPHCGHKAEFKTVETRPSFDSVRRRRECFKCSERFTTHEHTGPARVPPDVWQKLQRLALLEGELLKLRAIVQNIGVEE